MSTPTSATSFSGGVAFHSSASASSASSTSAHWSTSSSAFFVPLSSNHHRDSTRANDSSSITGAGVLPPLFTAAQTTAAIAVEAEVDEFATHSRRTNASPAASALDPIAPTHSSPSSTSTQSSAQIPSIRERMFAYLRMPVVVDSNQTATLPGAISSLSTSQRFSSYMPPPPVPIAAPRSAHATKASTASTASAEASKLASAPEPSSSKDAVIRDLMRSYRELEQLWWWSRRQQHNPEVKIETAETGTGTVDSEREERGVNTNSIGHAPASISPRSGTSSQSSDNVSFYASAPPPVATAASAHATIIGAPMIAYPLHASGTMGVGMPHSLMVPVAVATAASQLYLHSKSVPIPNSNSSSSLDAANVSTHGLAPFALFSTGPVYTQQTHQLQQPDQQQQPQSNSRSHEYASHQQHGQQHLSTPQLPSQPHSNPSAWPLPLPMPSASIPLTPHEMSLPSRPLPPAQTPPRSHAAATSGSLFAVSDSHHSPPPLVGSLSIRSHVLDSNQNDHDAVTQNESTDSESDIQHQKRVEFEQMYWELKHRQHAQQLQQQQQSHAQPQPQQPPYQPHPSFEFFDGADRSLALQSARSSSSSSHSATSTATRAQAHAIHQAFSESASVESSRFDGFNNVNGLSAMNASGQTDPTLSHSQQSTGSNALLDDAHFQALLLGKLKYVSRPHQSHL
jgi:hypothetical protein